MTNSEFEQFEQKFRKLLLQFDIPECYLVCIANSNLQEIRTMHIDKQISSPQIRMINAFTHSLLKDMIYPNNSHLN